MLSFEDLKKKLGLEVGVSRWFTIDQARVDKFADLTEDWQYIHVDPVAAKKTPFNGTIAHGFLTVSLLSAMYYDAIPVIEGSNLGVNYGFDRLRFLSPVKVIFEIFVTSPLLISKIKSNLFSSIFLIFVSISTKL